MNNSVMKCCICNNEKTGEFIIIKDKKYHLCCIEQLQNNWNELKEWLEKEIIEYKAIMNTILPELEEIILSINGKSPLINEYDKQQIIIKSFEVMLSKMQEIESRK